MSDESRAFSAAARSGVPLTYAQARIRYIESGTDADKEAMLACVTESAPVIAAGDPAIRRRSGRILMANLAVVLTFGWVLAGLIQHGPTVAGLAGLLAIACTLVVLIGQESKRCR